MQGRWLNLTNLIEVGVDPARIINVHDDITSI